MKRLVYPLAVFVLLAALDCGIFRQVTSDELAGTWVVTDKSREHLSKASRVGLATIILERSGRFTASEVPGELLYGPPDRSPPPWQPGWAALVTGTGVWELTSEERGQRVSLEFREITLGELVGDQYTTGLGISTWGSTPPVLYFYPGDPDVAPRIKFEKKKAAKEVGREDPKGTIGHP